LQVGIADAGNGTGLWGLGDVFTPAWQSGTWYHSVMKYDPGSHQLVCTVTEATGAPFMTFTRTVASFPADTTRLGVTRLHMKDTGPGASPSATIDYNLDNMDYGDMAAKLKLIAIDEVGYVPLADVGAEFLYQVVSERAERAALIITSNLGFSEWTQVFANARLCKAMVDRVTDRAHIIDTGKDDPVEPRYGIYNRAISHFGFPLKD
jgi:hypothetical protein